MAKFAEYGFNKSHSAAYALLAYQTAYLKTHYPVEFMAALLTEDMENTDKVIKNITDCRDMGIDVLPPDINASERSFKVLRIPSDSASGSEKRGCFRSRGHSGSTKRPFQGPFRFLRTGRPAQGKQKGG
jgi:hypothetical protein